jgi:protein tyrosine/serine phosphatase
MKALFAVLILITSLSVHAESNANYFGWFDEPQPPTQVTQLIWRSGRPTEVSLQDLWNHGVRAIIDLENDPEVIQAEMDLAKKMGFAFYSYPMDSFWAPDDAKMTEIINILRTTQVPVLVHCYHGEDRTGLVIGLERVFLEKWPAVKAYDEMIEKGFHQILLGLDEYFRSKTSEL